MKFKLRSVGVELEGGFITRESYYDFKEEFHKHPLFKKHRLIIGEDGSVIIPDAEENALELKYWSESFDELCEFIKLVFDSGFVQNNTCGNHIHFKFYPSTYTVCAVFSYIPAWMEFLKLWHERWKDSPKYLKRLENRYCEYEYRHSENSRYVAFNWRYAFRSHGTLECRLLPWAESSEELCEAIKWLINAILLVLNKPWEWEYEPFSWSIKDEELEVIVCASQR